MIYCLYVQNASPNAYTLAIAGKQPFIMLNTGLLELLNTEELQGVIAHEVRSPVEQRVLRNVGSPHSRYVLLQLGHLKCDHGVWLTVACKRHHTPTSSNVQRCGGLAVQMDESCRAYL
jgi:hypothetical protein